MVIEEDVVPGEALNLNSTNLPGPWSPQSIRTHTNDSDCDGFNSAKSSNDEY